EAQVIGEDVYQVVETHDRDVVGRTHTEFGQRGEHADGEAVVDGDDGFGRFAPLQHAGDPGGRCLGTPRLWMARHQVRLGGQSVVRQSVEVALVALLCPDVVGRATDEGDLSATVHLDQMAHRLVHSPAVVHQDRGRVTEWLIHAHDGYRVE